jgi:hypothetical protein
VVGFLDLEFVLSDRVIATPFAEVVRDFAEVPEARDAGILLLMLVLTEMGSESLLPGLLAGRAFLLLRWGVWEDLVTFLCSVVRSF